MADTLDSLLAHLRRHEERAKLVVWEHNSHVGDARQTQMGACGEHNLGQLTRSRHPGTAVLVGFTTFQGTVTAASAWDAPAERKRVRPALPESYERLFHDHEDPRFLLRFTDGGGASALRTPRLERAIGVIYRPETERQSHYFLARIASPAAPRGRRKGQGGSLYDGRIIVIRGARTHPLLASGQECRLSLVPRRRVLLRRSARPGRSARPLPSRVALATAITTSTADV